MSKSALEISNKENSIKFLLQTSLPYILYTIVYTYTTTNLF